MKHLLKKISLRGSGLFSKKPEVKAATLRPPVIGDFQFASSFSYIETLDLISDGPIEGLVNKNGALLTTENLSQGVYINGTPVQVANDLKVLSQDNSFTNISVGGSKIFDTTAANFVRGFFSNWGENSSQGEVLLFHSNGIYGRQDDGVFRRQIQYYEYSHIFPQSLAGTVKSYYVSDAGNQALKSFAGFGVGARVYNNLTNAIVTADNANKVSIVFAVTPKVKRSTKGNYIEKSAAARVKVYHKYLEKVNKNFIKEILSIWDNISVYPEGHPMRTLINKKMIRVFGPDWTTRITSEARDRYFITQVFNRLDRDTTGGAVVILGDNFSIQSGKLIPEGQRDISLQAVDTNGDVLENKNKIVNLLIPELDSNGATTGNVKGAYFLMIDETEQESSEYYDQKIQVTEDANNYLKSIQKFQIFENTTDQLGSLFTTAGPKYNYSNILIEDRLGRPDQKPFTYFNEVYIDKLIDNRLYGAYKLSGDIQRIQPVTKSEDFRRASANYMFNQLDDDLDNLPDSEGSNDNNRKKTKTSTELRSFTDWNSTNSANNQDEEAVPVTHVVYNPNVDEVFVTLQVDSLFDTNEIDQDPGNDASVKAGDKIPAVVNFQIETGKILADGSEVNREVRRYRIAAVVEGSTLIDIGNPHAFGQYSDSNYLERIDGGSEVSLSKPFKLKRVRQSNEEEFGIENVAEKRYVRITKLSTETFSILVKKDISVYKVTEIIKANLTYPYSAIIGTKLDSRQFTNVPERKFDVRLKKIKVPSNYNPTFLNGAKRDKRYYDKVEDFNNASKSKKLVYDGDWNGTFVERWTDNPAWVIYDLLTNQRYGLGQHISESEVNKWELYKIGRFCDAVDNKGFFQGVPDGRGGLEPRFSCNILFNNNEKIFDAIQTISNIFRGKTFFRSSEVSFVDDRIKEPIALFNNINVKDGFFNYANLRRDQQFNTVEVGYLDRFEDFTPKIEVIEDAEDIRNRGVFKTRIEALGVTSKAMARRVGQHLNYKTVKENQRVAFNTGLEALLCQPGDLIIVEDELKSNKSNFGKILDVDIDNQYIRLSNSYNSSTMTGLLTVYVPTGDDSIDELSDVASSRRERLDKTFTISFDDVRPQVTGIPNLINYTGEYNFSGYTAGYSTSIVANHERDGFGSNFQPIYTQYPVYTGNSGRFIYHYNLDPDSSTGHISSHGNDTSGFWILASGNHSLTAPGQTLNAGYDFSTNTSGRHDHSLDDLNYFGMFVKNGTSYSVEPETGSKLFRDVTNTTVGILNSEIGIGSNPQIFTLSVTGAVGNVSNEIGSFVSGVDLPDYLQHLKLGSPYRFEIKDASDFLYKVESIQEEDPNNYLVSASKFDTGKYNLIENNISFEQKENTFAYQVQVQVGDTSYQTLSAPQNLVLTTGTNPNNSYYIQADWNQVSNNNGYNVIINKPNGSSFETGLVANDTSVRFEDISVIGKFTVGVKAIGSDGNTTNKYFDSDYTRKTEFYLYEDLTIASRPHITDFTFN